MIVSLVISSIVEIAAETATTNAADAKQSLPLLVVGSVLTIASGGIGAWVHQAIRSRATAKRKKLEAIATEQIHDAEMVGDILNSAAEVYRQYYELYCLAPKIPTENLILKFIPVIDAYSAFNAKVNTYDMTKLKPHQVRAISGFKTHTCWLFLLLSADFETRASTKRQNQMTEAINQMYNYIEMYRAVNTNDLPVAAAVA